MGYIPPFTRTVLPQTANPQAVSLARAQGDINAQNTLTAGRQAAQIGQTMADYAFREGQARNATFVNEAVIQAKREAIEGLDSQRQARMGNPDGFHKDFDKNLQKSHESMVKAAPSEEARTALRQSLDGLRLSTFESNEGWERTRKIDMMGESLQRSGDNLKALAYDAGQKGEPLDQLIRDAQATTVAAGTILAPEKIVAIGAEMEQNVAVNYIEGLSEKDPLAALKVMDDPKIKEHFHDVDQYQAMKKAVESRATLVHEVIGQKQVLDVLRNENDFLTKTMGQDVPYSKLQEATAGMSPEAQKYFMGVHGYTDKQGEPKLKDSEKLAARAELYAAIDSMKGQDITSEDVAVFQNHIFQAMDKGALTQDQGINYLNGLVQPMIDRKEESLSLFQTGKGNPFEGNLGFDGLKKVFDDEIAVPVVSGTTQADKKAAALQTAINNGKKVKLYDYYMDALGEAAKEKGLLVGDLDKLNKLQKQTIYGEAQAAALKAFMLDQNPVLSTLNDLPNQTLRDGQLIPGAAGARDLKPDFTGRGNFVILEKDGHSARRYEDGTIEVIR